MRNLKKKIVALGLALATMASSVMSVSASAAEEHYDWGPRYWTPYTGGFSASTRHISAHSMKWTADQIEYFYDQEMATNRWACTEYEFRPVGVKTHDIWSKANSFASNMPESYYEFQWWDNDDIAVCCGDAAKYVAGTSYYGNLFLTAQSDAPTNVQYVFESEYGRKFIGDPVPVAFEQYDLQKTYFEGVYNW